LIPWLKKNAGKGLPPSPLSGGEGGGGGGAATLAVVSPSPLPLSPEYGGEGS